MDVGDENEECQDGEIPTRSLGLAGLIYDEGLSRAERGREGGCHEYRRRAHGINEYGRLIHALGEAFCQGDGSRR